MSTTVQQVIDAAIGLSFKNRPATATATSPTELVRRLGKILVEQFAFAAAENPDYFGTAASVPATGGSWAIPTDAESIYRVELADGTEVGVVDARERTLLSGFQPAIYRRGGRYYPAGNANDPVPGTDPLVLWYAAAATLPTTTTEAIDSRWPDRFVPILEYGLGAYLARKDGRGEEAADHETSMTEWMQLFQRHLQQADAATTRLSGYPRRVPDKQTAAAPAR